MLYVETCRSLNDCFEQLPLFSLGNAVLWVKVFHCPSFIDGVDDVDGVSPVLQVECSKKDSVTIA